MKAIEIVSIPVSDQEKAKQFYVEQLDAAKGNLADANVSDWAKTVKKVKDKYPAVKVVIPGHGDIGDKTLPKYTISLFQNNETCLFTFVAAAQFHTP